VTHARLALGELDALADVLHGPVGLPALSACRLHAQERPLQGPAPERLPADVLEELRAELRHACERDGAGGLAPGALRRAPLVLWYGEPQAAGFPGLLDTFLLGAAERPRRLRDLIEAWLRDFGPDRASLPQAGRAIAALFQHARDPRLVAWRRAQARFALFDARQGPERVGSALLHGPESVPDVLAQTGMDDPLRAGGRYFRAVMDRLLDAVPGAIRGPHAAAAWQRAAGLLEVDHPQRDRKGLEVVRTAPRFAEAAGRTAQACLLPAGSAPVPKEEVKAFLRRNLGDPRTQPARWETAGEAATQVMRSWLAAASLEAFLALISETNDDKQWRYRQAFWRACLRRVPSAEVWVVLGPGMTRRARAMRDLADGYGRMEASGSAGEQAVLLMRLGSLVLSEWSNVGPVRAWERGDRACPQLYEREYDPEALRALCLSFPNHPAYGNGGALNSRGLWHRNGDKGLWQGCAAALLQGKLQIRLTSSDYMPP